MNRPCHLEGRRGLVIGIANEQSIAYGCAAAFAAAGAELAVTYLNAKAEPFVRPIAERLGSPIILPCDVRGAGQLEAVFDTIAKRWGRLDFLLHAIAYAERADLHGRVVDCSAAGFALAMDVSCHSFIRMAKLAEPLMAGGASGGGTGCGGTLLTVSFYGGEKVVPRYNLMGPVKAALESVVKYLAAELGPKGIRVNAVSPGPIHTRAASGLTEFEVLYDAIAKRTPSPDAVTIEDVGAVAAMLVGDGSRAVNGEVIHVDGGYHVMG